MKGIKSLEEWNGGIVRKDKKKEDGWLVVALIALVLMAFIMPFMFK